MKKTVKKILAFLICIVMVFTIAPLEGFIIDAQAAVYSRGDIIEFGSYPQTKVKDKNLISKLNGLSKKWISYKYYSGTDNWSDGKMKSGDFMKYTDVSYNGVKYRGVKFTQYLPWYTSLSCSIDNSYQDENGYKANTTYWFKYEPLKWRVIDPANGLVLAVKVIDGRTYNDTIYYKNESYQNTSCKTYANDYAKSSIRKWLNDGFYNTAFSGTEKSQIVTTTLDNRASKSKYNSATTNDKVFMLSKAEASNKNFGFSTDYAASDKVRKAKATDYSKCQGIYVYSDEPDKGNGSWWLRTPGSYSSSAGGVYSRGDMTYDYDVNYIIGVRPAMVLKQIATNRKDLSKSTTVLSSVTNTVNGPQLKWKSVSNASGYYVYRKTSKTEWKRIGMTSSTSYIDKTAKGGTTYIYTAKAYNVVSTSKFQSGLSIKYLAAPKISSLQNSVTGPLIKWNKSASASGYQVYRKVGSKGSWAKIATVKTTQYRDTTAKGGTTYYYTIRAYSGSVLSSFYSSGSAIKCLDAPKISKITNALDGSYITWNQVAGAKGYYVYRKTSNGDWARIGTTAKQAYKDKKIKANTTYYYAVRAYDGSTLSSFYASGTATKFLKAPKISSVQNTVDGTYIKWNKVSGISQYQVMRRTANGDWKTIAKVSETNYRDNSKLTSGTTYYYSVKSVSGKITSSMNSGTAIKYIAVPKISTIQNAIGSVYIKWDKVTGAKQYQVQKRVADGDWKVIATVTKGTSYKDTSVENGKVCYYSIKALNGNTISSMRSGTSFRYVTAPQISSVQNAVDSVYIKWNKIAGASGYQVHRRLADGDWVAIATVTDTSYRDTSVESNVTYYYSVKALNGKVASSMRKGTEIRYLASPVVTSVTKVISRGSEISWNEVAGASQYQIRRKFSDGKWEIIATVNETRYNDVYAKPDTTYYYTVRAIDGENMSSLRGGVPTGYLAAPTVTSAVNVAEGVEITWSKINGATEYQLHRRTEYSDWEVVAIVMADTRYVDSSVVSSEKYYYTVKALNSYSESEINKGVAVRYLETPGNPIVSAMVAGAEVTWKNVNGASEYQVMRKTAYGEWSLVATVAENVYRDYTLRSGETYYYAVKATDGETSSDILDGTSINYLKAPTVLSVTNVADGIEIIWSEETEAELYQVYKRLESGGWRAIATLTDTTYTDHAVENSVTYNYAIKAVNAKTVSAMSYEIMVTR